MEHQSTHRAFIGCSGKLTKAFKSSKQETKKEKTRIKEESKFSGREKSFSYFFPPFAF
jgi:hypothetical protein